MQLNLLKFLILKVKEDGKSLKEAAKSLNINYSTAKTILRVFRIENRILKKSPYQKRNRRSHRNKIFNYHHAVNSQISNSISDSSSPSHCESENPSVNDLNLCGSEKILKLENLNNNPSNNVNKENLNHFSIKREDKKVIKEKIFNLRNSNNILKINSDNYYSSPQLSSNMHSINTNASKVSHNNLNNISNNVSSNSLFNLDLNLNNNYISQGSSLYSNKDFYLNNNLFSYPEFYKSTEEFMESFHSIINMLKNCIGEIINNDYTIRSLNNIIKSLGLSSQNSNMINIEINEMKQSNYSDILNKNK